MPLRTISALLFSIVNALLMLWLTFFLLSITLVLPDEYALVQWASIGKNLVLGLEKKPDSSRFLFVNVSWDKILIDKLQDGLTTEEKKPTVSDFWLSVAAKDTTTSKVDKTPVDKAADTLATQKTQEPAIQDTTTQGGETPPDTLAKQTTPPQVDTTAQSSEVKYPIGSLAITDRAKLVALLKLLHKNPNHKLLLIDVFFKDSTPNDSALTALINTLPRTLVSSHIDDNDKPEPPDLKIKPTSLSNLEKAYGMALKFKLYYNDSIKTTPIRMYETIYNKKFKKGTWFYYLGDKPILNSFILDYRVRKYDYDNDRYPKAHLGEWVTQAYNAFYVPCVNTEYNIDSINVDFAKNFVHKLTKDKIIIVGDFEDRDIHETIYGAIPGPIILLDAFLAVEAGDNMITIGFLSLLFFSYFFITYITLMYNQVYPKWVERLIYRRTDYQESFLETFTVYLLFFATVSLASFFLFNIHVGVLVLAFYMNILEKVKKWQITKKFLRLILREKAVVKEA